MRLRQRSGWAWQVLRVMGSRLRPGGFFRMPGLAHARFECVCDIGETHIARFKQHKQMVKHIRGFGDQRLPLAFQTGDQRFDRLLAELARARFRPGFK